MKMRESLSIENKCSGVKQSISDVSSQKHAKQSETVASPLTYNDLNGVRADWSD